MNSNNIKRCFLIAFLVFINLTAVAQERSSPKLVRSKGDYTHTSTGTVFPEQIESYSRKSIYSFTKQDDDIEVTYEIPGKASVAIKIYPAGDGTEGRLRREYLKTLQTFSDAAKRTTGFDQGPVRRAGTKYICNGFKAITTRNNKNGGEQVALYECGSWFFRVRIKPGDLESSEIEALENRFLNRYDPTRLTELKPLNPKSEFIVAPALGKDRERAKYILKSGMKKLEWANSNVPENERASGFPDLYLNMHIAAFKEFAESKNEDFSPANDIAKWISDINKVIKAGYLPEFIMKQHNMVMTVPENMKFDFEGFAKWQEENKISTDVQRFYYVIVYRQPK
jgi:hypothetical protein